MKKVLAVMMMLSLSAALSFAAPGDKDKAKSGKTETVTGWVSDAKCAAKGTSEAHAACAKKCIESGEKMVVVNDKDKSLVSVANPDALKGHEGHHVAVTGTMADGALHVDSVKML